MTPAALAAIQGPRALSPPPRPPWGGEVSPAPPPDPATAHAGDSPQLLDPVTLVAIPPKGAPGCISSAAMHSHLAVAQAISEGLTDPAPEIPEGLSSCLSEMSQMTPSEHIEHQRRCLGALRAAAKELASADRELLEGAAPSVRAVLSAASPGGLRVSLIERYMRHIDHPDTDLPRDLREGFPLVGDIPVSPAAPPAPVRSAKLSLSSLLQEATSLAPRLVEQHSAPPRDSASRAAEREVFSQTQADVSLGRMGPLRPLGSSGTGPPYTRRFGVTQTSSHGKAKLRCIDDFAQSLVNDAVSVDRRIRMGRISDLVEAARRLRQSRPDAPLSVLKSDFQAAYRSCPIHPDHVPLANILVRDPDSGELRVSAQYAMPFGAVSAVYAWDRLGDALTCILQKVFLFPVSRYVDDLFMPVWDEHSRESRRILLEAVSLFGAVLSPEKTPEPSSSMPVLGVLVVIDRDSVHLSIEQHRIDFWLSELARLRGLRGAHRRHLACRMAGRLEFAAAASWGAMPRSHFNGLYRLASGSPLDEGAAADIAWLLSLMVASPPERTLFLAPHEEPPLVLYTDASGSPANGLGAVLFDGDRTTWTSCRCPPKLMGLFRQRKTQINLLEVCGVILGLWTFEAKIRGRRLVIFVDNQAALGALKKGRSSVPDLNTLVSVCRELLAHSASRPVFFWVPSELNWADAPSRGQAPLRGDKTVPVTHWQCLGALFA